ncbi:MAG: hypothetical protein BWY74_03484 [Firmicutes bacterium ADurb.Bin419]|nr:MAG: hypothetical protein BWY74_03484 [Firmicutes bacterium ADurb.Bin419]
MDNSKVIKLSNIKSKARYDLNIEIFDLPKVIKSTFERAKGETFELAKVEYEALLKKIKNDQSNKFYLKMKEIFETVFQNPDYFKSDDTYLLLLYFVNKYIYQVDIILENDKVDVIAHPENKDDVITLSILNLLITNYRQLLNIKRVKTIELLSELLRTA